MTTVEPRSLKSSRTSKTRLGMEFRPHFVPRGTDPYMQVRWEKRESKVKGAEGEEIFAMKDLEAPVGWSQLAVDIAASKYLRRSGVPGAGHEVSIRQLIHRVAHTARVAGENLGGYFRTPEDAQTFENELVHILVQQKGAFNSPVWFNCGLYHEYEIQGTAGGWHWSAQTDSIEPTPNAYVNPQCSACFIQSVDDDLMSIYDLLKQEARIFKYGSGSGTNFSRIRSRFEKLSGGGLSSGLLSFLEVLDRSAGATKSGGTTRRAAKMVCLDMDHPEIEDFITWKMREEKKVKALIDAGYSSDFNGDAYKTVAGQNSNNSVRLPYEFMKAVEEDKVWNTRARTTGEVMQTVRARDLWRKISEAAWSCADPGLQFHTTINAWHTCPESGAINSSNPCSEYMFLDNSACNLASINLTKFLREDGSFDVEGFEGCVRTLLVAQDIFVDFSSYPTKEIAQNSHDFRPLGLGYANLGTLLMVKGFPYDSQQGRDFASAITALMTGSAYKVSAEIASQKGAFKCYAQNARSMKKVILKHREEARNLLGRETDQSLTDAAVEAWDEAFRLGEKSGFRNAQVTVLAPTGTIGFLMDCDTTGVEPDFALVKFKKLAGGGYLKIVNQSVPSALRTLGYSDGDIKEIIAYAIGVQTLKDLPHINAVTLKTKGLSDQDIKSVEAALPSAFDLVSAVSGWVIGDEALARLKIDKTSLNERSLLEYLGFTKTQIEEASEVACGRMTLEGAPRLHAEHLPVFDCANRCGAKGTRFIAPMGHLRMMAAVQPFLSGAISKTVNLPNETSVEEIEDLHFQAWKLGLKAVAVYRDGCKQSQPLSGKSSSDSASVQKLDPVPVPAPAQRTKLPYKRNGRTIEARVGGHQVYVRTGEFEDGSLGEIFIDMHKEGATIRSLLNCFAISISLGLQYGVPLEDLVNKFVFTRFEPAGFVDHPHLKQATSILDYIFRLLAYEYLGNTELLHVKPGDEAPAKSASTTAGPIQGLDTQLASLMTDAPLCSECGHVTVRNGTCYRCMNCGSSMGCS